MGPVCRSLVIQISLDNGIKKYYNLENLALVSLMNRITEVRPLFDFVSFNGVNVELNKSIEILYKEAQILQVRKLEITKVKKGGIFQSYPALFMTSFDNT
jgi:hypothetical protein